MVGNIKLQAQRYIGYDVVGVDIQEPVHAVERVAAALARGRGGEGHILSQPHQRTYAEAEIQVGPFRRYNNRRIDVDEVQAILHLGIYTGAELADIVEDARVHHKRHICFFSAIYPHHAIKAYSSEQMFKYIHMRLCRSEKQRR